MWHIVTIPSFKHDFWNSLKTPSLHSHNARHTLTPKPKLIGPFCKSENLQPSTNTLPHAETCRSSGFWRHLPTEPPRWSQIDCYDRCCYKPQITPPWPRKSPNHPCLHGPSHVGRQKYCQQTPEKGLGVFTGQMTKSTMSSLTLSLYRNGIRTWDMNLGSMLARPRLRLFLPSLLSPGGPANNQVVKLPGGTARQIYAAGKIICLVWRWSKAQKQCKSLGCQIISWP